MSTATQTLSSKKRKLPPSETAPSPSKSKKSKKDTSHKPSTSSSPKKKTKTDINTDTVVKTKKSKRNDKKQSEFRTVHASLTLSVPPVFADKPRQGVEELLDSMVMRYIPALSGVVLAHSNTMLSSTATIQGDCPFLICQVEFDATVWAPFVGMKLVGRVSLHAPDHISLLIHRTFNVSIPKRHIPLDQWVYSYGAAENDPEFQPGESAEDDGHRWTHAITGDVLGGQDGVVEFTVVGLTVANEMLSLLGSMQFDPFSPEHEVEQLQVGQEETAQAQSDDEESVHDDDDAVEEDAEEEEDAFAQMNKMAEEAEAAEKKAAEAEAKAKVAKEEKAQKRKAAKELDGAQAKKPKRKNKTADA